MRSKFLKVIVKVAVVITLFSLVTMHLWNALMPDVFGLSALSFLQALGLLVLSRLLFGGFGALKEMSHFMARKERQAILENWHALSPEQRAERIAKARSGGKGKSFGCEKMEE